MRLAVLHGDLAVARLAPDQPVPIWAADATFSSVTRTPEELSVVCAAEAVPEGVTVERGFRALRVVGRLDFALTGVLASIAGPLAAAKVSLFVVSTYDTDYVLVQGQSLRGAVEALRGAGHDILDEGGP